MAAVFLAYQPAWQGGLIWDDDAHVTRPELRSLQGLYRIWFDLGATQQYYPLLHSAFWVEHRLWGDATLGLPPGQHPAARRGGPDGGVHPAAAGGSRGVSGGGHLRPASGPRGIGGLDHRTEEHPLGRVLSRRRAGLSRFRRRRETERLYWWAFGLFVLGLLSKTGDGDAAGGACWWSSGGGAGGCRGGATCCRCCPFSSSARRPACFTAWVERKLIGAEGAAFELTLVERCLIAGPGDLVLPGQAPLARRLDLHLSALADQPGGLVAIPVPGGGAAAVGRVVGVAAAVARAAGGPAVLRRNAVPGAGLLQCVPVHLFVRGRSLPVSGEPGDHRLGVGRRGVAAGAAGGFGVGRAATCCAWGCWRSWPA